MGETGVPGSDREPLLCRRSRRSLSSGPVKGRRFAIQFKPVEIADQLRVVSGSDPSVEKMGGLPKRTVLLCQLLYPSARRHRNKVVRRVGIKTAQKFPLYDRADHLTKQA